MIKSKITAQQRALNLLTPGGYVVMYWNKAVAQRGLIKTVQNDLDIIIDSTTDLHEISTY